MVQAFYGRNAGHPPLGSASKRLARPAARACEGPCAAPGRRGGRRVGPVTQRPSLHSCTGSRGRWYQVTLRPWPTPRGSGNRKESPEPGARERVCFAQNRARACPKTDRRRDENGHVADISSSALHWYHWTI